MAVPTQFTQFIRNFSAFLKKNALDNVEISRKGCILLFSLVSEKLDITVYKTFLQSKNVTIEVAPSPSNTQNPSGSWWELIEDGEHIYYLPRTKKYTKKISTEDFNFLINDIKFFQRQ